MKTKKKRKTNLYFICESDTLDVIYVGITVKSVKTRFKQHLSETKKYPEKSYKTRKLNKLFSEGRDVFVEKIWTHSSDHHANVFERRR